MDGHMIGLLSKGDTPPLSVVMAPLHRHVLGSQHSKPTTRHHDQKFQEGIFMKLQSKISSQQVKNPV